jgi:hypothetical protein
VVGTGSIWLGIETSGEGSYEHGDEPSVSINAGKFLSSCTICGFSRRAHLHEVSYLNVAILCKRIIEELLERTVAAPV